MNVSSALRCTNTGLCFSTATPFYFSPGRSLLENIPDHHVAVLAPVFAYWILSLFFHILDISGWEWLDAYRLHDSEEVKTKNLATRTEVVWAVLVQQFFQTILGYLFVSEPLEVLVPVRDMSQLAETLQPFLQPIPSLHLDNDQLSSLVYVLYWWAIPVAKFYIAILFLDTWQYFLHRGMHLNKFLYKQFHSWHHRLYVPYAFGSLYNHPLEGIVLDSLGAIFAESLTGMTPRQAMFLFTISTLKTVDDHCGYRLPFDPLQLMTSNNADYHDIHHQVIGIKSNFSQPFFVHWDVILGTRMTRKDIEQRRRKLEGKKL
ncbi:hypothetical protein BDN72DRAFT_793577 [Pluteus cervinus]|uniref:Uncharacterized protein n=1 Tax=Pluteus cervinus TaxID=181527 RepID=A0ACD3B222_9AGAR|nr:hypothetical protein BDN72DRAFT_793577 [Pluteus cervinus]